MYTPDDPANWLTLQQAILAYKKSERTMRRLLHSGVIEGAQVAGKRGLEWRVRPPGPAPIPDTPDAGTPPPPAQPGTAMIPIADVEHLLAPYVQAQAAIQAERDTLAARVEELHEARRADAEELGRLRGRLDAVEAELARARQLSPITPPAPPVDPPRRRWPWSR